LNYKLDVRNVQTLLMISHRTLKKASSHHSGCVCTQQAPNLPLTEITDGLFTELGTHTQVEPDCKGNPNSLSEWLSLKI
jgi:hypothetical protein